VETEEIVRNVRSFIDGASPKLIRLMAGRIVQGESEEIKARRELAEKYGEIAEKMGEERGAGTTEGPKVSPARSYRKKIEESAAPCGICIQMLRKLEEKPLEMQMLGTLGVAEAEGAAKGDATTEELKEIMGENTVLKQILVEMSEESKGTESMKERMRG